MFKKMYKWLLLSGLTLSMGSAFAAEEAVVNYRYHDVKGLKAEDLLKVLHKKPAHAEWEVKWDFGQKRRSFEWKPECKIRYIKTTPYVTITKHRWKQASIGEDSAKSLWNTYQERLAAFEQSHIKSSNNAAVAVEEALRNMEAVPNCIVLRKKAHALAKKVSMQYRQLSKELRFTTQTGHMSLLGLAGLSGTKSSSSLYRSSTTPLSQSMVD